MATRFANSALNLELEREFRSNVSRETLERLQIYHDLLLRWQGIKNLVSRHTLDEIWCRHFIDSAQILALAGDATHWVDMGSGAGFPGLVVAILQTGAGRSGEVHLIEADHRKCAFLRDVSRETGAGATVHCARIEDVIGELEKIQVVTARALAPLAKLVEYGAPLLKAGATGIFLKGQDIEGELTDNPIFSMFDIVLTKSKTDIHGRVVVVRNKNAVETRAG